MSNARLPRLCLAAALVLLVSGCTLVNPHVKWPPPTTSPKQASQVDLDYAIDYADSAKAAYRKALGTQSKLTSWLGVGLIPLAAASLGLGITGGPPAAIAGLAATGAAAYATGTWLSSKPAQRAYVAGFNATGCAVSAVVPLVDVETRRPEIEQAIASVDSRVSAVETAVGIARARLTTVKERTCDQAARRSVAQLMAEASREIDAGRELVTAATDTRTKARKMLHEAAVAGLSLKEAVDRIAARCPPLSSRRARPAIPAAIINGLAGSYGQFVRVPETATPAARGAEAQSEIVRTDPDIQGLRQALDALRSEMGQLRIALAQLADEVNVVTASKPLDTLKACGVSLDQIAVPITLEPSARAEFDAGTPATKASSSGAGRHPTRSCCWETRALPCGRRSRSGPRSRCRWSRARRPRVRRPRLRSRRSAPVPPGGGDRHPEGRCASGTSRVSGWRSREDRQRPARPVLRDPEPRPHRHRGLRQGSGPGPPGAGQGEQGGWRDRNRGRGQRPAGRGDPGRAPRAEARQGCHIAKERIRVMGKSPL